LNKAGSGTDGVLTAAAASASKKAQDIIILDVSARLVITDHFLICSANTDRQVRSIAEEIERRMIQDKGRKPVRREGNHEGGWVVLDFIDFVVHVFRQEERDYYELERLWSDVPVVEFHDERKERDEPAAAEAT
jgi:ribosome-associated protein